MKTFPRSFMLAFVVGSLAACGGSSGGGAALEADASTASPEADASTASPEADASGGSDADVEDGTELLEVTFRGTRFVFSVGEANFFPSIPEFELAGYGKSDGRRHLDIRLPGPPGTYSCAQGARVFFLSQEWGNFAAGSNFPGSDCTVTVTKSGGVGDMVRGTFAASAKRINVADEPDTIITGSFRIVRKPDL